MTETNKNITQTNFDAHILIVEDDDVIIRMITHILEDSEIRVSIANNGEEAIEKIENNTYDLILMDNLMPKLNGVDATKFLRKKGVNTPVILITGAGTFTKEECEKIGITDVLDKLSIFGNLIPIIKRYVSIKKENPHILNDEQKLAFVQNIQYLDLDIIRNNFKGYDYEKDYINELYRFKKQYSNFKSIFFKHFDENDYESCLIKIHNLKNIANIIGAPLLVELSSKIEHNFKNKSINRNTIDNIDVLLNIINTFLNELDLYLPVIDEDNKNPKEIIKHLHILVEDMDYRVFDYLETNESILNEVYGSEMVSELRSAVEKYDYEKLTNLINTMLI